METARQTALMEQPEIVELFRVLEGNGLTKEQKEVEFLVKYLDGMEIQFGQVLEELRDVKEQLSQIQDGGVKASVLRITEQAQEVLPLTQWMYPVNEQVELPESYQAAPKAKTTLTVDNAALTAAVEAVMNLLAE